MARSTRATMVALGLATLIFAAAMIAHSHELNDAEIVAVPLNPDDPNQKRIGQLEYRGGLDIPPMGQNIGGLSGLRWDAESGRLLAITDDARWVWLTPAEEDGQLVGIADFEVGNLLGVDGEPLTGKEQSDSESLTRSTEGGWLIGFERNHRVLSYASLSAVPTKSPIDPVRAVGPLDDNGGLETLATSENLRLACAERTANDKTPNCLRSQFGLAAYGQGMFFAIPPSPLDQRGGVPTDADILANDTVVILFRSYSPQDGSGAALVAYAAEGTSRELAVLLPPLTVDNFEGLAVREEGDKTFLYIVSDDNFSSNQRTLLMKFEVLPQEPLSVQ